MTEGVRIDIVAGLPGAGKSTFIRRLLQSLPNQDRIAVWQGNLLQSAFGATAPERRPTRILLEADEGLGFDEAAHRALGGERRLAFPGARVAVVDARNSGMPLRELPLIREASHVFLNRAAGLDCVEQARLLQTVWSVNPRATLLVDPLDGLSLWMLLDIFPPENPTSKKQCVLRS